MSTQIYSVTDMPGYTFNWSVPAGWTIVSGSTTNQITMIPEVGGGMLSVNAVNSCGSGTVTGFGINPSALPNVSLGLDSILCENDVIILSVASGFSNYQWSTGATGVNFISLDTASLGIGTYLIGVTVTDNNGCTGTDNVSVTFELCSFVSNENITSDIKIFPNPVNSMLQINVGRVLNEECLIELLDMQGRQLKSYFTNHQLSSINMTGYPTGMYMIRIKGTGIQHVSRIVKY